MPSTSAEHSVKRHVRGSTLLLLGRGVSMLLNLAVQVVLVRYLSLEHYGNFAFALALISFASSCAVFGLDKTASRILPILDERGERRELLGALLAILSSISVLGLACVVLAYASNALAPATWSTSQGFQLLLAMIWLVPINALEATFLAVLSSLAGARAVFLRRHVLGPGLKLLCVVAVTALQGDVFHMAYGYLGGAVLAILVDSAVLLAVLKRKHVLYLLPRLGVSFRELFSYAGSFFLSDMIHLLHSTSPLLFIQYFGGSTDVAAFRSVLPVARLNEVVRSNFAFLFIPASARLFAQHQSDEMNELYWRTTLWVMLFSFPVFVATFIFAEPLVVLLFGEPYRLSASILSVMAAGYYGVAVLGFNTQTLRTYGQIRFAAWTDIIALAASVAGFAVAIPALGPLGAAVVMTTVLLAHALVNQLGLLLTSAVVPFEKRFLRPYACVGAAVGLLTVLSLLDLGNVTQLAIATATVVVVLGLNRDLLEIHETYPELRKVPGIRWLAGNARPKMALDVGDEQLLVQLAARAAVYEPAMAGENKVEVSIRKRHRRSASILRQVEIRSGQLHLNAICKSPTTRSVPSIASDHDVSLRPKNVPVAATNELVTYESAALQAIASHLERVADNRFKAVRVFDQIPHLEMSVIEQFSWPTLNALLTQSALGSERTKQDALTATSHAGAWLKQFHLMDSLPHTRTWRTSSEDLLSAVGDLTTYLAHQGALTLAESQRITESFTLRLDTVLPAELPCAVSHGDFAPRNVLVGPQSQVAVIDTLVWLRTPIYRDLACFLTAMELSTMRIYSRRRLLSDTYLARLKQSFLKGYFGERPIPHDALQLFRLQAILEKWSAEAEHRHSSHSHWRSVRWHIKSRFYKKLLLQQLPDASPAACGVA